METSFASRRPAAGGLPHFQLPPPNPMVDNQVPRVTGADGLSPLSSSVNSGSSQSSQAGVAPYNPTGSWPLPGGTSSYTYSSMNQGQSGLMQPNYSRSIYTPSGAAYNRPTHSPATGEGLTAPPYDSVSPPFPLSAHGGGGSHHSMLSQNSHQPPSLQNPILNPQASASQPPTPSSATPNDNYSRPPPTPGYYAPPSSTPQQSSFPAFSTHTLPSPTHHSPTTSGSLSRGIPSISGQPPMQGSPYANRSYGYALPPAMGGAVLSNMANPGGQMSIVNGMNPMSHAYSAHMNAHMYSHGQAAPQQDRPFKCDVCTQCFNRNHDLKRHKRIHLAVKPFPCTFCDKSFSRKDALKRHRLVKGCGNGKTSPTDDASSPQDDGKLDADTSSNSGIKEES
ncbi:hypothetical protein SCUP515_09488 [Seiridium cupressi]